jgi:hypothetical protein
MPSVKRILSALIPAIVLVAIAAAVALAASTREVGQYPDSPFPDTGFKPGCAPAPPAEPTCKVIAHVTGFQTQFGRHKRPFVIGHNGTVVALTVKLGKPDTTQVSGLNAQYRQPAVRLAVIKRPKSDRRNNNFKLLSQSEVFKVGKYLGSTPTFALKTPLRVPAGATLALTVPTWAPVFAIGLSPNETWRATKPSDGCNGTAQSALQKVGKVALFGCTYETARLLYTATFVPDPKPTS